MTRIWILYSLIAMALVGWVDSEAYAHLHAFSIGHILEQPRNASATIKFIASLIQIIHSFSWELSRAAYTPLLQSHQLSTHQYFLHDDPEC